MNYKLTILLAAVTLAVGCEKEHLNEGCREGGSLKASIAVEKLKTRSLLIDNPGINVDVSWIAGDEIGVNGSMSGSNIKFATAAADIFDGGKQADFKTTGTMPTGEVYAYFPYQSAASGSGATLNLEFPAVQHHTLIDNVPQPYAPANMMAAKGSGDNLVFRNMFSMLKVGISGTEENVVKQIVFSDLSGKPVSGAFTVSWTGDVPLAVFPESGSGSSLSITLDCGGGVPLTGIRKFYMSVPARHYPDGFKIEFILDDGGSITKTVGASGGKTLSRSTLHVVGDSAPKYEEIEYEVGEGVSFLSEERAEYIEDASVVPVSGKLMLYVGSGFDPKVGEKIIINETSDILPAGFAGKVTGVEAGGDGLKRVTLEPIEEITEIFDNLTIGGELWNSENEEIEGAGVELDLSSYVTRIETAKGEVIPFSRSGSTLNMSIPMTRTGVRSYNFSTPYLTYTHNPDNTINTTMGVGLDLGMKFSAGVQDRRLLYFNMYLYPALRFMMQYDIALSGDLVDAEFELLTIHCAPIPVGPILLMPVLRVYVVAGIGGQIGLSAKAEFREEFGFGFSYMQGDFRTRNNYKKSGDSEQEDNPLGLSSSIQLEGSVSLGLKTQAEVSIYKVVEAFCSADTRFKLGGNLTFDYNSAENNEYYYQRISESKASLVFDTKFGLGLRSLGGLLDAQIETESIEYPLWVAHMLPEFTNLQIKSLPGGQAEVSVEASRHLLSEVDVGILIYETHPETFETTRLVAEYPIGSYKSAGPPTSQDPNPTELLETTISTDLELSTTYKAYVYVEIFGVRLIVHLASSWVKLQPESLEELRKVTEEIYNCCKLPEEPEWDDEMVYYDFGIMTKIDWLKVGASESSVTGKGYWVNVTPPLEGCTLKVSNHPWPEDWGFRLEGDWRKVKILDIDNDYLTNLEGRFAGYDAILREVADDSMLEQVEIRAPRISILPYFHSLKLTSIWMKDVVNSHISIQAGGSGSTRQVDINLVNANIGTVSLTNTYPKNWLTLGYKANVSLSIQGSGVNLSLPGVTLNSLGISSAGNISVSGPMAEVKNLSVELVNSGKDVTISNILSENIMVYSIRREINTCSIEDLRGTPSINLGMSGLIDKLILSRVNLSGERLSFGSSYATSAKTFEFTDCNLTSVYMDNIYALGLKALPGEGRTNTITLSGSDGSGIPTFDIDAPLSVSCYGEEVRVLANHSVAFIGDGVKRIYLTQIDQGKPIDLSLREMKNLNTLQMTGPNGIGFANLNTLLIYRAFPEDYELDLTGHTVRNLNVEHSPLAKIIASGVGLTGLNISRCDSLQSVDFRNNTQLNFVLPPYYYNDIDPFTYFMNNPLTRLLQEGKLTSQSVDYRYVPYEYDKDSKVWQSKKDRGYGFSMDKNEPSSAYVSDEIIERYRLAGYNFTK